MTASDQVLLRIRPSLPDPEEASAARGPLMMEAALSAMHALKRGHNQISLEIGVADGKIALFARSSKRSSHLIESQLYAQYPDAEIEASDPRVFEPKAGERVVSADLIFTDPEVFPIKRHPQFIDLVSRQHVDTIAGLTSALVRYPVPGMRGHIQITLQPLSTHFRHRALKFLPLLTKGLPKHWRAYGRLFTRVHLARGIARWLLLPLDFLMGGFRAWFIQPGTNVSFLTGAETEVTQEDDALRVSMRSHEREDPVMGAVDKVNRLLFVGNIRVSIIAPESALEEARAKVEEIAGSFRQFTLPSSNGLKPLAPSESQTLPTGFRQTPYILSVEEIASLWHLPNILVKTPNFDWVLSKKLEPPVDLPLYGQEQDLTVLGEAVFRGERRRFGIRAEDRRRHMYIIGKTGMGKSTLLENMLYSDISAGKGVALIDPHGDLVDAVLRCIPKNRMNDFVLFDPADKEHPMSFNMLACPNAEQRSLVASGMMSVFKKLWPDVWSGRMEYILRNALLALLESEGNSMLGILRMFSDNAFRARVLEHVNDQLVKTFWEIEYEEWSEKYRTEAIAAVQNKIGQLLSVPLIRNIVGQVTSTLDIRHAMDTGKIILVNLSKGKLGEDNSAFLGSMLVTKFQLDAMSRADVPENDRPDFYLYVDEFQNFATESFATILSEARKYHLNLTMANQYVAQLLIGDKSTVLKDAVFGNVGSLVSFQVGSDDAEVLSEQLEEMVAPKDILSLPKYHAYVRLMIRGIPSKPFSVMTLPPPDVPDDARRIETIKKLSRERYAEKRTVVEEKIAKWMSSARVAREAAKDVEKQKEKEEEERQKARKRGMSLEDYRQWRDRELWTNEYNALRKKKFLGEELSKEEQAKMQDLEKKLEASGGVPPPSKTMLDAKGKKTHE
jgi:hypothetical protein